MRFYSNLLLSLCLAASFSQLSAEEQRLFAPIEFGRFSMGSADADFSMPDSSMPEVRFYSGGSYFSAETDLLLGQKQRNRGGGGRVWTNLYYGNSSLEPKEFDYKIKPEMYGIQFGFDIVKSHGVYATFFGNYHRSETDLGIQADSRAENYMFGFGHYIFLKGCHFGYTTSFSYDHYNVRDRITTDKSKGDGMQANLLGEFGVDLVFGRWAFKPFYALQYDFLYQGRIDSKERVFAGDGNEHSLIQLFGMRTNWKPFEMLEFQSRLVWVHEMLDNPPPFYNVRFSPIEGAPSTPAVNFFRGNTGRDWAWIGLSAKIEVVFNIYLYLDYDLTINERHMTHFGNLGFCLKW